MLLEQTLTEETRQNNNTSIDSSNGEYRFFIIPAAVLFILILLVSLASYFNYHTYFFKISKGNLELWHGDFAPLGYQICSDFEPIQVSHHDFSKIVNKKYKGIERAYGALYGVFIGEAEEELNNGCEADLKKVDHCIEMADKFFPFCYRINPRFARTRFEVSWKKIETLKDLLSVAYQDSLEHINRIQSLGVSKGMDLETKKEEADDWLKDHPVSP
ncbi:MAG: hypothetical protein DRG83_10385 [Deltaproteobacteria bacterium]|nr:MAG: hypothetical protein DRG83_10385 [Deltaproteobacteria bacterium]